MEAWKFSRFDEKGRLTHQFLYDSTGKSVDESPWFILKPEKDALLLGTENIFEVISLNYDTTALIDFALGTAAGESSEIFRDNRFLPNIK